MLTHAAGAVPRGCSTPRSPPGSPDTARRRWCRCCRVKSACRPPKGDRLTDWLRRPLSDDQMQYAAADVEFLLEVHDRLGAKLTASGRTEWVFDACEELRTKPVSGASPDDAWLRLKDATDPAPQCPRRRPSVAAWRERRAMRLDVPVRQVLPDLAILGISQRATVDAQGTQSQARGVDDRHGRGSIADEILVAVQGGQGDADAGDTTVGRRPGAQSAAGRRTDLGVDQPAGPRRVDRHRTARDTRRSGGVPAWRVGRSTRQRLAGRAARRRHPIVDRRRVRPDLRRSGSVAVDSGRPMTS